ncbi:MAG: hypothetical protein RBS57_04445 [Desulforhabdus sp.]|jgi:predicted hydrocarbon binding protein|nr:hypothetical protein [Desulforhabdus sp.]
MEVKQVPVAAVERSLIWIEAVENALAEKGGAELADQIMRAAGKKCALQILADCEEILGKKPETVDELLNATNRRRLQRHSLANLWERDGNTAHLKIDSCACTLVRAGLARPNPVHCRCSKGLMVELFSTVTRGPVHVEMVKTVGCGDDCCEFMVYFED